MVAGIVQNLCPPADAVRKIGGLKSDPIKTWLCRVEPQLATAMVVRAWQRAWQACPWQHVPGNGLRQNKLSLVAAELATAELLALALSGEGQHANCVSGG
jgi:hypothetical protein